MKSVKSNMERLRNMTPTEKLLRRNLRKNARPKGVPIVPALDYMREFTMPEEAGLIEARNLIEQFVKKMEKEHAPEKGEAWPHDRNHYCIKCTHADGGCSRHPCSVIRAVRKFLGKAT